MSYINRSNTYKLPSNIYMHNAKGTDNGSGVITSNVKCIGNSSIGLSHESHNIKKQNNRVKTTLLTLLTLLTNIKNIGNKANKPGNNLCKHIPQGQVVAGSHLAATAAFRADPWFNHVVSDVTPEQYLTLISDKSAIMAGNIEPLVGKGIIATDKADQNLPTKMNLVRFNSQAQQRVQDTDKTFAGIICFSGVDTKSSELIPGSPLGNYFNQQRFDNNLKVLTIHNGNRGTLGCQFDLAQIEEGTALLINAGQLSGGTMAYAIKDNIFFSYHAGKNGNDASEWETGSDGARSIIDAHNVLTSSPNPHSDAMANNQTLVDFLANNFDFYSLTYCGHGEKVVGNANVFDYRQNKVTDNNKVQLGSAMALITRENDKVKVQTLSDNIMVNINGLTTQSLAHRIGEYTWEAFDEMTHL
ncbi:cytotoxic necrotizing factor [Yersinia enterocolitica]|uniref:cytotoxic necrotizing factor Rho-activating domain-containing protein n=1 Tax=Yersinia enterocolitica TaxID=630 RepID=UPI00065A8B5E|nr:cytotoxic necrotizing factor Rho-activating domain-containing protein [Yersinia enterocolitica]CRY01776.1 cytotoxic necrotizing factor [Yersinia enterocolitica]